jgi:hypothetical protein
VHERGNTVFFEAVKVDIACLLDRAFFVVLDARSSDGKVGWKDGLQPIDQEKWRVPRGRADLGPEALDDMRKLC